jgi:tRNA 5-methylaminomethyl-2-thiouridine biosynthesis bifunctional protein
MPESNSNLPTALSEPSPFQLQYAELEWQPGDVPVAKHYGDIYFSKQHGLHETEYVFLQHNQLAQRWQQLDKKTAREHIFTIAETGFGTGLNFLASWRLWKQFAPEHARLHFISVEKHPLQLNDLQRSLASWPQLQPFAEQLISHYPVLVSGHHLLNFDADRVTLHLLLGDALDCLEQLRATDRPELAITTQQRVDAWFLDGFAPAKNPDLWNEKLYTIIAQLSKSGTTLATFTAAGDVRRGLAEQGFNMQKVPGFGLKREMLTGIFDRHKLPSPPLQKFKAPWYFNSHSLEGKRAVVIGGGLAGTSSAYALAKRGWQVTLLERQQQLAQGASGNPQGMLYTKLSAQSHQLSQFTLSSYLYALRFYRHLVATKILPAEQLNFCGVLQLAIKPSEQKLYQQLQRSFAGLTSLVQFADPQQASIIAGMRIDHSACYFPQAGWLSPSALCQALATHPNIEIRYNTTVLSLDYAERQWQLSDATSFLTAADTVIIANSSDARLFSQTQELPLKTIRGQISLLDSSAELSALNTVISHEGYITPAINDRHSLGATFDINDSSTEIRIADHQRNLASLQKALPAIAEYIEGVNPALLAGRVGLRCTSPDYLPLVGPVPTQAQFLQDYAPLRYDANRAISHPGSYYPGLYINVAHGSRGLTSIPLGSELLAATINHEPVPVPRALNQALNPARFIIRDLIRNRI